MYKKMANFLRGSVTLRIQSPYPERIVNLCAVRGIPFWSLHWQDEETFILRTSRAGEQQLRAAVQQVPCQVTRRGEKGAPLLFRRLRRHYVLLAGFVLFLLLLFGGIGYTAGSILYGLGKRKKWMHSVFHIFVVLGSLCHSVAVIFYVL